MNGELRRIIWLPKARTELQKIINYIQNDSPQNASKVKIEVLQKISELLIYPPDKFKLLNAASRYRAFELHKIRISYYIDEDQVMIIRVRHVKQEPLFY